MVSSLLLAAGSAMRAVWRALERARGVELPLFILSMTFKLALFNRMIAVRNMQLTNDDILVAIGTLAVASFWTIWLSLRGRIIALAALNLLLTAILYADLVYFRYFQDLISVPVLLQAGQVGALGGSIAVLLSPGDWVYFADWLAFVPLALYAVFRGGRRQRAPIFGRKAGRRAAPQRLALGLIVLASGAALAYVPINTAKHTWAGGLFTGNWWNVSLYNITGLYGFHGYDLYRYVQGRLGETALPAVDVEETRQWFERQGAEREALASDRWFGAYEGSSVVMVQAEAFQNFVIGRTVGGREITPHLNELLADSVYFPRFYHQTSQGRTADADFAAHCSQQPLPSGAVFIRYANHTFDCLPGLLKDAGYTTAAYHAYEGGFWNRNAMYAAMRYDHFYSKKHYVQDEAVGWSLGDDSFFRQSSAFMREQQRPFYAFLITLSSHHPYTLPTRYEKLDVGEFDGTIFGHYLQSVHYVDAALGRFVEQLKADGVWDDAIFLFYGDHDNSIREWEPLEKLLGQPLNAAERQQILKQVPLVVHLPDGALGGATRDEVGGQIDLAPTILHLLGIDTAGLAMVGTPLVIDRPLADKQVVFRNGAYTDGSVYYIPAGNDSGCFDAHSGDPLEEAACTAGAAQAASELRASANAVEYDLIGRFREEAVPAQTSASSGAPHAN